MSEIDSSKLIYVTPVEGIGTAARLVLADAIAAALQDAGKPAILSLRANEMGPTVAGSIVAVEERDSVFWVTAVWELRAPYGTVVTEFRQQVVVDKGHWEKGTAEAINLLVFEAGPGVVRMVGEYVSPMPAADIGPPAETLLPVPPAAGAEAPSQVDSVLAMVMPPVKPFPPPVPPPVAGKVGEPRALTRIPPKKVKIRLLLLPVPEARPSQAPKPAALKKAKTKRILLPVPEARPSQVPKPAALKRAKTKRILLPVPEARPSQAPKPAALKKAKTKRILLPVPEARPSQAPKPVVPEKARTKPVLMPVPEADPTVITDPPPVTWGRPSFLIKTVQGAPGDGNRSLTEAIKNALRKRDLTVTEDPRQAGFVITGQVSMGVAVNGRQQAKVVWSVDTIDGQEVGKAIQKNVIRAGSLNGSWGRVADIVSNAAVVGIQELFGIDEKNYAAAAERLRKMPEFPNITGLKRVPGRALPPP